VDEEGWFLDPFHVHEARWFSAGVPTSLVRDGGQDARDDPPAATYVGNLTPVPEAPVEATDDRRADDAERQETLPEGGLDVFDRQLFGFFPRWPTWRIRDSVGYVFGRRRP
jgi:hypothetical protein